MCRKGVIVGREALPAAGFLVLADGAATLRDLRAMDEDTFLALRGAGGGRLAGESEAHLGDRGFRAGEILDAAESGGTVGGLDRLAGDGGGRRSLGGRGRTARGAAEIAGSGSGVAGSRSGDGVHESKERKEADGAETGGTVLRDVGVGGSGRGGGSLSEREENEEAGNEGAHDGGVG